MTFDDFDMLQFYTGTMRIEICAAAIALGHNLQGCK